VLDDDDEQRLTDEEKQRLIDVGANLERSQNEDRRREDSEKFWRRVGIAGLVVLAATVTKFPYGSPYEGEPLSLALLLGALLQIGLALAGIVYGAVLTYRIGKWALFKVQARSGRS
jgi:hypothetical protein